MARIGRILFLVALTLSSAKASDEILAWDANSPLDQVKYYTVYSTPPNGSMIVLVSQVQTNRVLLTGLHGKQYLSVSATNDGGESQRSTNLVFTAKPDKPVNLSNPPIQQLSLIQTRAIRTNDIRARLINRNRQPIK